MYLWKNKPLPPEEVSKALSKAINVNPFLAALLVQRGIKTFDEAKAFFRPSLDKLYDPFLLKDMDKAVARLSRAISSEEKILVYGDYDVDGTTSVAMVYHFLSTIHSCLGFYIPDRYTEGYGISFKGIDYARENGYSLIISLDCGIKSPDKVKYATEKGIDFIICDHHNPGEEIPEAVAVLDPKRKDCPYPFKELSGCGVGFKLLQAYCKSISMPEDRIYDYLDLLTVSIAADIVPITDENRIFCYHGLKKLNERPRQGLQALSGVAGFKKNLNISNVVFGLAPRINAAGRIEHAHAAVDLLLANDEKKALSFAQKLNEKNITRKDFDVSITKEAIEMLQENPKNFELKTTVLFKNDWHKGVVGIVASRCIEKFYRPTIILTESNGKITGSARSVDGFDIYEAICECADLLDQYGGHAYAAGLTLPAEKLDLFKSKFEEVVAKRISEEQLIPKIDIDLEINFSIITEKFYKIIEQMGPFGPGNMTPVFKTSNVIDTGYARVVGDNHLKMTLKEVNDQRAVEAIGFGLGHFLDAVKSKNPFEVCYTLAENTYNDITTIQLIIKDIKF